MITLIFVKIITDYCPKFISISLFSLSFVFLMSRFYCRSCSCFLCTKYEVSGDKWDFHFVMELWIDILNAAQSFELNHQLYTDGCFCFYLRLELQTPSVNSISSASYWSFVIRYI